MKIKSLLIWYGIAVAIVVLDQISKAWAESVLAGGQVIVLTSFFRLELAYNTGAAFSLLYDAGGWQRWFFSALAFLVSLGIVIWIARLVRSGKTDRGLELLALALILGGALGNLYDRLVLGHVVDFIVWHYRQYHWPTFNIADAAISVGAALLIVDMFFVQAKQSNKEGGSST